MDGLSSFSNTIEVSGGTFEYISESSSSDFSSDLEISGDTLSDISESNMVDFIESGDAGLITITSSVYGEGVYGEGPYGGNQTITISYGSTIWTNVDEP